MRAGLAAVLLCGLASSSMGGCAAERPGPGPAADARSLEEADRAYADAWLANDPERVMATLTGDAVIVPSGLEAIRGAEAIRRFWWPAGAPATTVTEFTTVQHESGRSGDLAYVRGSFTLGFEDDGRAHASRGQYLSVLRRQSDGSWRISHRMWNDHPPRAD